MRPDEWTRVKDIFAAALPLPGEARSKYLNDACGPDAALRVEVETLLASHEQATPGFLLTPADISPAMPIGLPLDGRQIGPYRFSSRIGVGGMGEVYKARDTRLDRTVAIKVLPAHIAADQAAKDRFEREARAVASLNHPNICTLHDIGSQDGIDFLVMEYLDGETLANRLRRGAIPPTEALQYAIQICSALDRVHRAGIVHRDLKPATSC